MFIELLEKRQLLSATISGVCFKDANLDGIRQSTELPLAGEKVYIDANNNGKLDLGEKAAASGSTGSYSLTGLADGKYRLRALPPTGWRYDWTGPTGFLYDVPVTSTSIVTGKNFGNTQSSIIGKVYNDLNASGSRSTNEPYLTGWKLYIDKNRNSKFDLGEPTAISNSAGTFAFPNLPAGDYSVRQFDQSGWRRTQIVANNGAYGFHLGTDHVFRGDFGNTTHPLLSGKVFKDLDGDGIIDAGESPLFGVRVFIDKDHDGFYDVGEPTVLTSATGSYAFSSNITAGGPYTVRIVIPGGLHATKPTGGVFSITLTSGQTVKDRNFGLK